MATATLTTEHLENTTLTEYDSQREQRVRSLLIRMATGQPVPASEVLEVCMLCGILRADLESKAAEVRARRQAFRDLEGLPQLEAQLAELDQQIAEAEKFAKQVEVQIFTERMNTLTIPPTNQVEAAAIYDFEAVAKSRREAPAAWLQPLQRARNDLLRQINQQRLNAKQFISKTNPAKLSRQIGELQGLAGNAEAAAEHARNSVLRADPSLAKLTETVEQLTFRRVQLEHTRNSTAEVDRELNAAKSALGRLEAQQAAAEQLETEARQCRAEADKLTAQARDWREFDLT
jgi:hypothetical protein